MLLDDGGPCRFLALQTDGDCADAQRGKRMATIVANRRKARRAARRGEGLGPAIGLSTRTGYTNLG